MKHFNKILCPYDFSEYADEALKYAIKLADPDTLILLLNIIQLPYLIDPNGFTYYDHKAEALQLDADLNMNKKLADLKMSYPNYKFEYSIDIDNDPAARYCLLSLTQHGGSNQNDFNFLSASSISTSLILAYLFAINPCSSKAQFSFP